MTKAKGKSQTQAGIVAAPSNHKDTGKPMAKATALAWEMPRIQAIMAAKKPAKVVMIMATEGYVPWSTKKMYKNHAAPQTPNADKGQRIKFDNWVFFQIIEACYAITIGLDKFLLNFKITKVIKNNPA